MTPQQVSLVQSSWDQVMPIQDTAASLFYQRLFDTDPALRPLFKGDMQVQGRKLMSMITVAVRNLGRLPEIVPAVQDLGRRHVGYGVKPADYATVGAALLWTLEQGLGEVFTPEVRAAWTEVYGVLASTMQSG